MFFIGVLGALLVGWVLPYRSTEVALIGILFSYYLVGLASNLMGASFGSGFVYYGPISIIMLFVFSLRIPSGLPKSSVLDLTLLLMILLSFVSLLYTDNIRSGFDYSLRLVYGVLLPYLTVKILSHKGKINILKFEIYWVVIWSAMVIFAVLLGGFEEKRFSLPGTNSIYFSLLCAITILFSLGIMLTPSRRQYLYMSLGALGIIISIMGLALSGGRGALFALFASILILIIMQMFRICIQPIISVTSAKKLVGVLVAGVISAVVLVASGIQLLPQRAYDLLKGDLGMSGEVRVEVLREWLNALVNSPYIGVGAGAIEGYPHNILLELVVVFGISGGIIALVLALALASRVGNAMLKSNMSTVFLGASGVLAFINGLTSFSIWMLSYLFVVLALLGKVNSNNQELALSR